MADPLSYTREQLEYLWDVNQKELAVLTEQSKDLNEAIARLERNSAVLQSLFDLNSLHENKDKQKTP